jgi:putative spermidine/putrescine transport system substrate-binding protein
MKRLHSQYVAVGALICGLVLAATGTSAAESKRFDGVELKIGTWGGKWKQAQVDMIAAKFEKLGGTITYVTGSPQSNLAKLIVSRGRPPFDMMEILDAQIKDFRDGGLLQEIDLDQIPNKMHIEPSQYSKDFVGTWNTQEVMCYNVPKFEELKIPAPRTYSDLMDPRLERRVSIPDISSGGGLAAVGALAHFAGGDETNIMPGLEMVKKINPLKFWSRGGDALTQFQTGDIYVAMLHSGWCLRAYNAGSPVAAAQPEIKTGVKGVAKEGWFGIMKGSKNADAAHWYINEFLDPEFQFNFAVKTGVVPISQPALARINDVPVLKDMVMTDPADRRNQLRIDYSKAVISDWTDLWGRTVGK